MKAAASRLGTVALPEAHSALIDHNLKQDGAQSIVSGKRNTTLLDTPGLGMSGRSGVSSSRE